jgi:hypothetical protein
MPIALAFINTPSEPCDFDDDDKVKNLSSPRESAPGSLSREYPLKEIDDEAGAQRRKGANIFAIVSSGCALVCKCRFTSMEGEEGRRGEQEDRFRC